MPVASVRALEEYASDQIQDLKRATLLLSVFGGMAVVLALIGIFGVITHLVAQRRMEIAIRIAMGAEGREVVTQVLRQGVVVIVVGLILGTAGAMLATRMVGTLLYGVTTLDPITFALALALLAAVGLLACYLPARRASQIEPVIVLRGEQ